MDKRVGKEAVIRTLCPVGNLFVTPGTRVTVIASGCGWLTVRTGGGSVFNVRDAAWAVEVQS